MKKEMIAAVLGITVKKLNLGIKEGRYTVFMEGRETYQIQLEGLDQTTQARFRKEAEVHREHSRP